MSGNDTDVHWEKWGKQNPYYGVLSEDRFLSSNLSAADKTEFFRSGEEYIEHVFDQIRRHIAPDFAPQRAVDFGCGVGRLVVPLSRVAESVVGIDVSTSMIEEAQRNCEARSIGNVDFVLSDDTLSGLRGELDFIHSFIVFQHIPVERGEQIFDQLLSHLRPGGVGAVHFTYARKSRPPLSRTADWLREHVPFAAETINLLRGRDADAPQMQMNAYDLSRLSELMEKHGVCRYFAEFTKHGNQIRGVLLYFQRESEPERSRAAVLDVAR